MVFNYFDEAIRNALTVNEDQLFKFKHGLIR
jgi:hypothetical protein